MKKKTKARAAIATMAIFMAIIWRGPPAAGIEEDAGGPRMRSRQINRVQRLRHHMKQTMRRSVDKTMRSLSSRPDATECAAVCADFDDCLKTSPGAIPGTVKIYVNTLDNSNFGDIKHEISFSRAGWGGPLLSNGIKACAPSPEALSAPMECNLDKCPIDAPYYAQAP